MALSHCPLGWLKKRIIKIMQREKVKRNKEIMERIEKGDYQIDIARDFNIKPPRVSAIKKKYSKGRIKKNKIKTL